MAVISEPGQMTRHATSASGDWAALQVSCEAQHLPDALHDDYRGMMMFNQWQMSFMQHPHELLVFCCMTMPLLCKTLGITTTAVADCLCAMQAA